MYECITRRINRQPHNFFKHENYYNLMSSRDVIETFTQNGFIESPTISHLKSILTSDVPLSPIRDTKDVMCPDTIS